MICVSIGRPTVAFCREILHSKDVRETMAEIRLDGARLSLEEVREIFGYHTNLIATCRTTTDLLDDQRMQFLKTAIRSGAAWVDIDIQSNEAFRHEVAQTAMENRCRIIYSYHNYHQTSGSEELQDMVDRCFQAGASVAKIACTVHDETDNARILSLYARPLPQGMDTMGKPFGLVALGMGERGKITRVAATYLGAPFTYASIPNTPQTAKGQLDYLTMRQISSLINSRAETGK